MNVVKAAEAPIQWETFTLSVLVVQHNTLPITIFCTSIFLRSTKDDESDC